jgi:hypothetical protein
LLLVLASAVIFRSESRGTHDHILLSQIQDPLNLEGQVPVFISLRNMVVRLYPRHWVPFSSPSTTLRATVEVFDPDSTRDSLSGGNSNSKSKLLYDWRFSANQFILESSHNTYFFELNSCGNSPYVTIFSDGRWVCLSSSVHFALIAGYC